jgi:hypothetical protein
MSVAVLAALAIGGATPLFAQTANDDPAKDPPAGGRIPASEDTPQSSGDTSSNQPNQPGAATNQPQGTAEQVGQSGSSGATQGGTSQPGDDAAGQPGGQPRTPGSDEPMRDRRSMQDQPGMEQGSDQTITSRRDGGMQRGDQQQGWGDEGRSSRYSEFQGEPYQDYYGRDRYGVGPGYYGAERGYERGRYYDRDRYAAERDYRGRYYDDRDWNAFGEFGSHPRDRYYGPRWGNEEEGSGYTYRDRDDYYAGRDYDYPPRSRYERYGGPDRFGPYRGPGPRYHDPYPGYRDPYEDQWRGGRYSRRWQDDRWLDERGMAGRWDDRDYPSNWRHPGMAERGHPHYYRDGQQIGAQGRQSQGSQQWQQGQPGVTGTQPGTQSGSAVGAQSTTGTADSSTGNTGTQSGSSVK